MKGLLRLIFMATVVASIVGYFYFSDAQRYKTDLESYLQQTSGYDIKIRGELDWHLLPSPGLSAEDITATDGHDNIEIGLLTLGITFGNIFANLNSWNMQQLMVEDLVWLGQGSKLVVRYFVLRNFKPKSPAPFDLTMSYADAPELAAIEIKLKGDLTFIPIDAEKNVVQTKIQFTDTALNTPYSNGICFGEVVENNFQSNHQSTFDEILPVVSMLEFDASFDCSLTEIRFGEHRFAGNKFRFSQNAGKSTSSLSFENFFGGRLQTSGSIDLTDQPIEWALTFSGENIQSRELLKSSMNNLNLHAPLKIEGQLKTKGNTEQSLDENLKATVKLKSGEGSIDVSQLKQALILLDNLGGFSDDIAQLPNVLSYNSLMAELQSQPSGTSLKVNLDNLEVSASGKMALIKGDLNLNGTARVTTPKSEQQLKLPSILLNTPIPFRCRGRLMSPSCKPDTKVMSKIVFEHFKEEKQEQVKRKIDKEIERAIKNKMPEELKDVARQLLNLFDR